MGRQPAQPKLILLAARNLCQRRRRSACEPSTFSERIECAGRACWSKVVQMEHKLPVSHRGRRLTWSRKRLGPATPAAL